MTKPTIALYGSKLSGHSHRVELMLNLLDLPYVYRTVDLRNREQKTPEFLALNPFGTVPVLDDGGAVIADSAACLVYLASRYDEARRWLPTEPFAAAQTQRWLSVAQGPVFNGPAAARIIKQFGGPGDHARALAIAAPLLDVLEGETAKRPFLVGAAPTIADIAIYSYIARAPEGGVSLDGHPAVLHWLGRVEALPGFLAMPVIEQAAT